MGHLSGGEGKIVVISNRAPYTLSVNGGRLELKRSVSGLVSAVEPLLREHGGTWVAWGGRPAGGESQLVLHVPPAKPCYRLVEVSLSEAERRDYYLGFANNCLWPLCHSFTERSSFNENQWAVYRQVNRKFAMAALGAAADGDLFWVHDYHFALVPGMIREENQRARVALFWHIPFPPYDTFSLNPWGREIISGMLASNLIAFHTISYVENFIECARRFAGAAVSSDRSALCWKGRTIGVKAVPVGLNWQEMEEMAGSAAVRARAAFIRRSVGAEHILLGVDRLDYTKGILERLRAFELFLQKNPRFVGRVSLIQIGVPTRSDGDDYRRLKMEVEETVGRINGRYDRIGRPVPVRYICDSFGKEDLIAFYLAADVALVTALRDGLNLVAKEFVACRHDHSGVLVLSRFAGAAEELKEAILVNPYDLDGLAGAIGTALELSREEAARRMAALKRAVRKRDLRWWWHNTVQQLLLHRLEALPDEQQVDGRAVNE
ncbi:MAG: trehalose-6-phosphate synthase [Peptococcaceae bacterium]|nr:trehalose-6-phosphate synthase [Peptococcaceae bacterium]